MSDPYCYDCQGMTSGSCWRHQPGVSYVVAGDTRPAPSERESLRSQLSEARQALAAEKERADDFEQKGKDLCNKFGPALVENHDLRAKVVRLERALKCCPDGPDCTDLHRDLRAALKAAEERADKAEAIRAAYEKELGILQNDVALLESDCADGTCRACVKCCDVALAALKAAEERAGDAEAALDDAVLRAESAEKEAAALREQLAEAQKERANYTRFAGEMEAERDETEATSNALRDRCAALEEALKLQVSYLGHQGQDADHAFMVKKMRDALSSTSSPEWRQRVRAEAFEEAAKVVEGLRVPVRQPGGSADEFANKMLGEAAYAIRALSESGATRRADVSRSDTKGGE